MQKFSQNYNWHWRQYNTRTGKKTGNKYIGPVIFFGGGEGWGGWSPASPPGSTPLREALVLHWDRCTVAAPALHLRIRILPVCVLTADEFCWRAIRGFICFFSEIINVPSCKFCGLVFLLAQVCLDGLRCYVLMLLWACNAHRKKGTMLEWMCRS